MGIYEDAYAHPELAQAIAGKDCHEIARVLSIGRTKIVPVPIGDIQSVLQRTGAWWAIKAIPAESPAYAAAVAVTDVAHARYENVHLNLPIVAQMFGALVAAEALPQEVFDEIMALGVVPDPLTQREVAIALYHDTGEPK